MKNAFDPVKIAEVVDKLNARMIFQPDGKPFDWKFANATCRFFCKEVAAKSINVPVLLKLDGKDFTGEITVGRDGSLQVRLAHETTFPGVTA